MKLILALLLLALVGCDDRDRREIQKAGTAKDFCDNWTMSTIEYEGHKFIIGTYGTVRQYIGTMVHHPSCCPKEAK